VGSPAAELTVVVMAFNEAGNLEAVVRELQGVTAKLGLRAEILVIDDGSGDETGRLADELAGEIADVRVVHHGLNQGLGGVYRTGFREARGDLLTFFPADGQFPAAILEDFLPEMAKGRPDIVLGYVERSDSLAGRALSRLERLVWRGLLGPLPRFQGVFLVRRRSLAARALKSEGRGWAIVMEMLVRGRRAGWEMRSRPTPMRARMSGVSKVQNLRTIASNLRQVLGLRARL
jgi:glycosyltransferase involved in cell wall biosynthesis